jgi:hypothetical protein
MSLDVRLHYAFFIEDSVEFVSLQYFIAFVALSFGMMVGFTLDCINPKTLFSKSTESIASLQI